MLCCNITLAEYIHLFFFLILNLAMFKGISSYQRYDTNSMRNMIIKLYAYLNAYIDTQALSRSNVKGISFYYYVNQ